MDVVAVLTQVTKEQASQLTAQETRLAEKDAAIQALQSEKDVEVATLHDELSAQDDRITQLELALTELLRERNDKFQVSALN